jgi:hypothetical protein
VQVTLTETVRPGLFRGVAPVVEPGATGVLEAVEGDTIYVQYVDASAGGTVVASARIDTFSPQITNISVKQGYMDATITWTTTEPTDARIQFGESSFLGRTEYRPEMSTQHSLRLLGLVPGRSYYYKIAVRDEAGNLTVNDDGLFLPFQTLSPLRPPFYENAEDPNSATNWTVVSTDDSQHEWSVGPPLDGHTSQPCQGCVGQNAWASNLNGERVNIIDSYLVSPALDLRGANVAGLTFMHDYDFTDQTGGLDFIREGRLMISTNVQTDPIVLAQYRDSIPDWTNVVMDLTPFAGRVVFLIWHHRVRSAATQSPEFGRPGWVIDEVRVTASNVPGGTIHVVNNIYQARFSLQRERGALLQSGQGKDVTFTNLPPGTYVVTFANDVPFYTAPGPKTNALGPGSQLNVLGNYTFADLNTNGISDAWENFYFGSLNPRNPDSDGDGFEDYAEFIAGTDPTNSNSNLSIADPVPLGEGYLRFTWPATPGRYYQLWSRQGSGPWLPFSNWTRAAGDSSTIIRHPVATPDPSFYRVAVQP